MKEKLIIKMVSLLNHIGKILISKRFVVSNRSDEWRDSQAALVYYAEIDELEYLYETVETSLKKFELHEISE